MRSFAARSSPRATRMKNVARLRCVSTSRNLGCGAFSSNVDTKATDDAGGDADQKRRGWWGRVFSVFAADQVDNPPAHTLAAPIELDSTERIAAADGYFAAVGADVVEGGNVACYDPTTDRIHLPRPAQFHTPALFYGTLAHEHIHWTAPAGRLDRTFAHRFKSM